ncbi:hypothetical protein HD554DRAFT_1312931 [Boletus coccyginus]|nr:hypothetical protein HD554DRAFT_1312931 [Boletus coccyginus]
MCTNIQSIPNLTFYLHCLSFSTVYTESAIASSPAISLTSLTVIRRVQSLRVIDMTSTERPATRSPLSNGSYAYADQVQREGGNYSIQSPNTVYIWKLPKGANYENIKVVAHTSLVRYLKTVRDNLMQITDSGFLDVKRANTHAQPFATTNCEFLEDGHPVHVRESSCVMGGGCMGCISVRAARVA